MGTSQNLTTFDLPEQFQVIINLALDGLTSNHSKQAYQKALVDFIKWYLPQDQPRLTKAIVQKYKTVLVEAGLAPSTVNQRISAIRKLAQEASDNGFLDQATANGIAHVKGVKSAGLRVGNWLSQDQAQAVLETPNCQKLKGLRDRAILAVMIGAGLRRSEVVALTIEHIQQREGRWVIVDLVGKGNRVRSVPIPPWTKTAIDAWVSVAGIHSGQIFYSFRKGDRMAGRILSPQALRKLVRGYAGKLNLTAAPHDLRRTFAKLAKKGGSDVDQIKLSLGHASIQTTERYLGIEQDLTDAPCDRLGLRIS
jgi:site-specific recombinase XerD